MTNKQIDIFKICVYISDKTVHCYYFYDYLFIFTFHFFMVSKKKATWCRTEHCQGVIKPETFQISKMNYKFINYNEWKISITKLSKTARNILNKFWWSRCLELSNTFFSPSVFIIAHWCFTRRFSIYHRNFNCILERAGGKIEQFSTHRILV